ncbi:MAG: shikimate dehydrogenase [Planctomycetota bacterium]|nr:MAG: shikimate dehydrogenase [Planctomycetota bacterium]
MERAGGRDRGSAVRGRLLSHVLRYPRGACGPVRGTLDTGGQPLRFGIVGHPVDHSLSPVLHAALAAELGIALVYERHDVPEPNALAPTLAALAARGVQGVNVTLPHKCAALRLARRRTAVAERAGAANTLRLGGGGAPVVLEAHNTDVAGFARSLREAGVAVCDREVLVLGAGGAARAVLLALERLGAGRVVVASRRRPGTAGCPAVPPLAGLEYVPWQERERWAERAAVVINATPLGMLPRAQDCPLERVRFRPEQAVADLVYRPLETALLARARAAGAQAVDGLGMLVHQGIDALGFWLGREESEPERARLARAGRAALQAALVG